jgi:serine/threonine protein kinase
MVLRRKGVTFNVSACRKPKQALSSEQPSPWIRVFTIFINFFLTWDSMKFHPEAQCSTPILLFVITSLSWVFFELWSCCSGIDNEFLSRFILNFAFLFVVPFGSILPWNFGEVFVCIMRSWNVTHVVVLVMSFCVVVCAHFVPTAASGVLYCGLYIFAAFVCIMRSWNVTHVVVLVVFFCVVVRAHFVPAAASDGAIAQKPAVQLKAVKTCKAVGATCKKDPIGPNEQLLTGDLFIVQSCEEYCDEVHARFSKQQDIDVLFESIAEQIAFIGPADQAFCLSALEHDPKHRFQVKKAQGIGPCTVRIFSTSKQVFQILHSLGLVHLLSQFHDYPDSELGRISQMRNSELERSFGIPAQSAVEFAERCRLASIGFDPDHERWLKACLIMRHCGQGIRPFVAEVMRVLHERVVVEVKQKIEGYKNHVCESDWKISTGSDELINPAFDCRPAELNIMSLDADGAAIANEPHRLTRKRDEYGEPFMLSQLSAAGIFQNEIEVLRSASLVMRSYPADGQPSDSEKELRFIMLDVIGSSSNFLQPFNVHIEGQDGDSHVVVTAVYCTCLVGQAPLLINEYLSGKPPRAMKCGGNKNFCSTFWTVSRTDAHSTPPLFEFSPNKLKTGDLISFGSGPLPSFVSLRSRYFVLNATDKSFDIASILLPVNPNVFVKAQQSVSIFRPSFPVGLWCDAACRYHTKKRNCELEQRWKGIVVCRMPVDFGEFAKCFCSTTYQDMKIFASDQERSPELLYNMMQFCTAFQAEIFASLYNLSPKQLGPVSTELENIKAAAIGPSGKSGIKLIRNKICHGDFHTLSETDFESLTKCADSMLTSVRALSFMMKASVPEFEGVERAASLHHDEIFCYSPTRACVLSRHMASSKLTADESAQMDDMVKQFHVERQNWMAKNQLLALQVQDLEAQLKAREKIRFSNLPVIILKKELAIQDQLGQQDGKRGGQAAVYKFEFRNETLMAKIFYDTKDGAWRRELNALSALTHPNIVLVRYVIYESYEDRERSKPSGYAMEPMACSLLEFARNNPFQHSITTHLDLLHQVAVALAFTHMHRFAHRDVTLSNILLNDSCRPTVAKLCDFGCAHFMQTNAIMSKAGGTLYFMAPEITPENIASLDPLPMDVYSFGVVIFKLLHPSARHDELCNCSDPNVWTKVRIFHPAFPDICSLGCACTDKVPSKRPTIQHVVNSLSTLIAGLQQGMEASHAPRDVDNGISLSSSASSSDAQPFLDNPCGNGHSTHTHEVELFRH